ncbi:hypothetical protein BX261_7114 [Streptomyces sp. 2321.6]|nr:hypothetical protein BX261_7114 [Streptomyces sp. 2321.6]
MSSLGKFRPPSFSALAPGAFACSGAGPRGRTERWVRCRHGRRGRQRENGSRLSPALDTRDGQTAQPLFDASVGIRWGHFGKTFSCGPRIENLDTRPLSDRNLVRPRPGLFHPNGGTRVRPLHPKYAHVHGPSKGSDPHFGGCGEVHYGFTGNNFDAQRAGYVTEGEQNGMGRNVRPVTPALPPSEIRPIARCGKRRGGYACRGNRCIAALIAKRRGRHSLVRFSGAARRGDRDEPTCREPAYACRHGRKPAATARKSAPMSAPGSEPVSAPLLHLCLHRRPRVLKRATAWYDARPGLRVPHRAAGCPSDA